MEFPLVSEKEDEDNQYEVSEPPEYAELKKQLDSFTPLTKNKITTKSGLKMFLKLAFITFLGVVLLLILILQCVTVYDLRTADSIVCEPTSSSSALTSNNDGSCTCNTSTSTVDGELLQLLMGQVLNQTRDLLSSSDMQAMYAQNNTDNIESSLKTVQDSAVKLAGIIEALTNLKETGVTTEVLVNDVLSMVKQVLMNQNLTLTSKEPSSCQDIKMNDPTSVSGFYHIHGQIVYCEMGEVCGSSEGWTRVGFLDMTDATADCPPGFRLYEVGSVRACGRPIGGPSCASVKFPSIGVSYSKVCGRVVGYQYASTDAVDVRFIGPEIYNDIDSYYADVVSITRGFPRQHLWSYLGGVSEAIYDAGNCPCNNPPGATQLVRPFMGNDYYCESGNPGAWTFKLYPDDPLWNGMECGPQESACCAVPGQPWFHRTFNTTSTEQIELRVCADEDTTYDDLPVSFYEIFVK